MSIFDKCGSEDISPSVNECDVSWNFSGSLIFAKKLESKISDERVRRTDSIIVKIGFNLEPGHIRVSEIIHFDHRVFAASLEMVEFAVESREVRISPRVTCFIFCRKALICELARLANCTKSIVAID